MITNLRHYKVTWEIELDATNPQDAAKQALAIQRDPNSVATVFNICGDDYDVQIIILDEHHG